MLKSRDARDLLMGIISEYHMASSLCLVQLELPEVFWNKFMTASLLMILLKIINNCRVITLSPSNNTIPFFSWSISVYHSFIVSVFRFLLKRTRYLRRGTLNVLSIHFLCEEHSFSLGCTYVLVKNRIFKWHGWHERHISIKLHFFSQTFVQKCQQPIAHLFQC